MEKAKAAAVLSLLALLVQKYKYWHLRWQGDGEGKGGSGTQFTGFTSTNVQILTPEEQAKKTEGEAAGAGKEGGKALREAEKRIKQFEGSEQKLKQKVLSLLALLVHRYSVYVLY
jgi:hypothetical protein